MRKRRENEEEILNEISGVDDYLPKRATSRQSEPRAVLIVGIDFRRSESDGRSLRAKKWIRRFCCNFRMGSEVQREAVECVHKLFSSKKREKYSS